MNTDETLLENENQSSCLDAVGSSTDILSKYLAKKLTKKIEQYEQNRKLLELGMSMDTNDKGWRLDKMRNILIEIDCIKFMLKDVM